MPMFSCLQALTNHRFQEGSKRDLLSSSGGHKLAFYNRWKLIVESYEGIETMRMQLPTLLCNNMNKSKNITSDNNNKDNGFLVRCHDAPGDAEQLGRVVVGLLLGAR